MNAGTNDGAARRRAKIRELFDRFVELPADERARELDSACASEPDLRAEVERLLAAHDRADDVLHSLEHTGPFASRRSAQSGDPGLDPLIGRTISHYHVRERIGDGGMGVVYRADDERLERSVALKLLTPGHSRDPAAKQRLVREAQAASALDHPNICTVYEIDESDDGSLFIAMAYCRGESLKQRLLRGPLSIDQALDVAIQLARGLGAVHRHGIIHRDIKPGNVIVGDDGLVRILDFGVARVPDVTVTRTGRTMGTVAYMSPEQAGAAEVDTRTDLWSLGVVLYEMTTGRRPFRGDHDQSVLHAILNADPVSPRALRPDTPESLERIILDLLRRDPAERPATAESLLADLEAVRDSGEPPSVTRDRHAKRARVRRHGALLGAGAVIVLGGLLGAKGLGLFAGDAAQRGPFASSVTESADTRPTIAVLPFDNLSSDPADVYFAEGVHEEILTRVARVAALKVLSRTSVLPYRERAANIRTIAGELGARYVVEGSVRRFGDRVVITAQLIDASTDDHLWGDTYERERRDLFGIQTDIAERIAAALRTRLSPQEHVLVAARPTENARAHDLYLRAGAVWSVAAPDSTIALLRGAIELDPEFALAFVSLARIHRATYFRNVDPTPERLDLARQAVDRALELEPDLPEAHLELGRLYYYGYRDYDRALAEFETARRGLPNEPPLYVDIGLIQRRQGRFEDAAQSFRSALDRDPSSYAAALHLGATLTLLGDGETGASQVRRAMLAEPNDLAAPVFLAIMVYCRGLGRPDLAREVLNELDVPANVLVDLAWVETLLTERAFDEAVELLESRSWDAVRMQPWVRPRTLLLGRLHQWLGHQERSVAYFDSARVMLEAELRLLPDDHRLHAALGHALAGLGRTEEAVRASRRATELLPVSTDALDGRFRLQDLADVFANVGEPERALEILDFLLSTPGPFSVEQLRTRPEWDPLVDEPGYTRLLERYDGGPAASRTPAGAGSTG